MKITGVLWDSCPNGDDCDKVYDMDGNEVGIRFQWGKVLTSEQASALGLRLPAHEGMLLYPRAALGR